jgi:hypothetical protein
MPYRAASHGGLGYGSEGTSSPSDTLQPGRTPELSTVPQSGTLPTSGTSPTSLRTAGEIVGKAALLVEGDRGAQHGPKERNHQNIADHWNAYLGWRLRSPLSALDVALMMVELKVARTKAGAGLTNVDNYVDMAGYAGVAGEIAMNGAECPQDASRTGDR